jgi:chemotaxis protein histidine kinase CheA
MSKFRKLKARLVVAGEQLGQLGSLATAEENKALFDKIDGQLQSDTKLMTGFVKKAQETDEDRKLYGPKMCKSIFEQQDVLEQALVALEVHRAGIAQAYEPVQMAAQLAAAQKQAAEEARLREDARQEDARRAALTAEREQALAETEQQEQLVQEAKAQETDQERALREQYETELKLKADCTAAAADQDLSGVLEILQTQVSASQFAAAIALLKHITSNLKTEFSDPRARHIKMNNDKIQDTLLAHVGGKECLMALGYIQKELTSPEPGAYMVLPEPDLHDLDAYTAQIMLLEDSLALLEDF